MSNKIDLAPRKTTVTLAMIVRNEAHIIERCLNAVAPYIDNIIVHDTGSLDGTQDITRAYIKNNGLHGYLEEVPWLDFGENRSNVLAAARNTADYTFMLDADEQLKGDKEDIAHQLANLTHDTYQMDVYLGDCRFKRNFLFKNARDWVYKDPIHEYPHCEGDFTTDTLNNCYILSRHDGARSKDPEKYAKDAAILESIENRTPRQTFYLAQSYKDAGKTDLAVYWYDERLKMGGYEQERFWSAYMMGNLCKGCEGHEDYYLRAYEIDPRRAEPLLALGKHYMDKGNFKCAEMFLLESADKTIPEDALFIEADVYQWRAEMEYAVCLYYLGDYASAAYANKFLINNIQMPPYVFEQVKKNLAFCEAKLK